MPLPSAMADGKVPDSSSDEQVQTNLGPNVGDITTGGKPALCSWVDSLKIRSP